jgi:hypothetical protein
MRFVLLGVLLGLTGCGAARKTEQPPGEPSAAEPGETQGGASTEQGAAETSQSNPPAPKVGTRALETRRIAMDFELVLSRQGSPAGLQSGSWSVEEQRTLEVVEAKGDSISKLRVIFGQREAKPLLGIEHPSPTSGKAYLLSRDAGGLSVKREDGKDVSNGERAALTAEYVWVGGPNPLLTELTSASGKELKPSAAAARVLIGEQPGVHADANQISVRVTSLDQRAAKLDVTLLSRIDNGDVKFSLELRGPAEVDRGTGFVTNMKLDGKVRAEGTVKHKKGPLDARGTGTANLSRKAQL